MNITRTVNFKYVIFASVISLVFAAASGVAMPSRAAEIDLNGRWKASHSGEIIEVRHTGNTVVGGNSFRGKLSGYEFSGEIWLTADGCPNLEGFVLATGRVSGDQDTITFTTDKAFSFYPKDVNINELKCTKIGEERAGSMSYTRVQENPQIAPTEGTPVPPTDSVPDFPPLTCFAGQASVPEKSVALVEKMPPFAAFPGYLRLKGFFAQAGAFGQTAPSPDAVAQARVILEQARSRQFEALQRFAERQAAADGLLEDIRKLNGNIQELRRSGQNGSELETQEAKFARLKNALNVAGQARIAERVRYVEATQKYEAALAALGDATTASIKEKSAAARAVVDAQQRKRRAALDAKFEEQRREEWARKAGNFSSRRSRDEAPRTVCIPNTTDDQSPECTRGQKIEEPYTCTYLAVDAENIGVERTHGEYSVSAKDLEAFRNVVSMASNVEGFVSQQGQVIKSLFDARTLERHPTFGGKIFFEEYPDWPTFSAIPGTDAFLDPIFDALEILRKGTFTQITDISIPVKIRQYRVTNVFTAEQSGMCHMIPWSKTDKEPEFISETGESVHFVCDSFRTYEDGEDGVFDFGSSDSGCAAAEDSNMLAFKIQELNKQAVEKVRERLRIPKNDRVCPDGLRVN